MFKLVVNCFNAVVQPQLMLNVYLFLKTALLIALLAACGFQNAQFALLDEDSLPRFDTTVIQLVSSTHKLNLQVELASTLKQRSVGLMQRTHLPANAGMLFIFPKTRQPEMGFWMFRTWVPLDIAFVNGQGEIVAIRSMEPCLSTDSRECPFYKSDMPYLAALEVNQGFFERNNFKVGDRVLYMKPGN